MRVYRGKVASVEVAKVLVSERAGERREVPWRHGIDDDVACDDTEAGPETRAAQALRARCAAARRADARAEDTMVEMGEAEDLDVPVTRACRCGAESLVPSLVGKISAVKSSRFSHNFFSTRIWGRKALRAADLDARGRRADRVGRRFAVRDCRRVVAKFRVQGLGCLRREAAC